MADHLRRLGPALLVGLQLAGSVAFAQQQPPQDRFVRLPPGPSVGQYYLVDPKELLPVTVRDEQLAGEQLQAKRPFVEPKPLPLAGEFRIPAGKSLLLWLGREGALVSQPVGDLSPLDALPAEDVDQIFVQGGLDFAGARQLARFARARSLRLFSFAKDLNTPEGYAVLGRFSNLEILSIETEGTETFGDDRLFKELAGLRLLRLIEIPTQAITDTGLEFLRDHAALESLKLHSWPKQLPLSNRSIGVVQSWPKLRECQLTLGNQVTDAALLEFCKCTKLEKLRLTLSRFIEIDLEPSLKRALPLCEVMVGTMIGDDPIDSPQAVGRPPVGPPPSAAPIAPPSKAHESGR